MTHVAPWYTLVLVVPVLSAFAVLFLAQERRRKRYVEILASLRQQYTLGRWTTAEAAPGSFRYRFDQVFASSSQTAIPLPVLQVQVPCPSGVSFEARKRDFWDRLGLWWGVLPDLKTGDGGFDRSLFIDHDDHAGVAAFFAVPRIRAAVCGLFALGCTAVRHDGKSMEAQWRPLLPPEDLQQVLERTARLLHELAGEPPRAAAPAARRVSPVLGWLLLLVPILLLFSGVGAFFFGFVNYPVLDTGTLLADSLAFSLPALAGFIALGAFLFRGRFGARRQLARVLPWALIGFGMAGFGFPYLLNGFLDQAPAAIHRDVIRDKAVVASLSRYATGPAYLVFISSWRGTGFERVPVSQEIYRQALVNADRAELVTRPGRLGYEWRVSARVIASN